MSIDWSKAPEDATHFDIRKDAMPAFMRLKQNSEDQWMWWGTNGWQYYGFIDRSHQMAQRPKQWTGEGKPPVGEGVCEYLGAHQYDEWTVVNIFAHWGEQVFVDYGDGWRAERDLSRFRPIRTPEQIAAELKKAGVEEMIAQLRKTNGCGWYSIAEDLYDAGYRKVTP